MQTVLRGDPAAGIAIAESTMVHAFVAAELDSPRFGPRYQREMHARGWSRREVLATDGPRELSGRRARAHLLALVRGYNHDRYLFSGFPQAVDWCRRRADAGDLERLHYANFEDWNALSEGTRRVHVGARNALRWGHQLPIGPGLRQLVTNLRVGRRFPPLIAVERKDGAWVLLEGHMRATAYATLAPACRFELLLGRSPAMDYWRFC